MEKTIKEWLEELPDGYRERALANCTVPNRKIWSLHGAISEGFTWDETREGGKFWCEVYEHYKTRPLPPLPTNP